MGESKEFRISEEAFREYRKVMATKDILKPVVIGSFEMTEQEKKRLEKT